MEMENEPLEEYQLKLKDLSLTPKKLFQKITCPSCNNKVLADNININDKIAKCGSCNVVFPFVNEIEALLNPTKLKQEVLRPEGIEIFRYKNDLDITVDQPQSMAEVLIVLVFLPIVLFFSIMLYLNEGASPMWPIGTALFWILGLYNLIANGKKSKIFIAIDDKYLDIKWRPKKLNKDQKYNVDEIDQLYTKTGTDSNGSGYNHVYMIVNAKEGQKHVRLLGTKTLSKARYLEQEIEKHLGIKDRIIPEEKV